MARPKRIKCPAKLTLSMEKSSRDKAHNLATTRGTSVGQLFVGFIEKQTRKVELRMLKQNKLDKIQWQMKSEAAK